MKLFDVYPLYNITPINGKGVYIYDEQGTKYLDLYGGHGVISIGHSHPTYVSMIQEQVSSLGFYSNAIQNPLQTTLASKLGRLSGCDDYNLFLVNSGAEANENALKVASLKNNNSRVVALTNSFHGRTSAAVAATDNTKINAPINLQHKVTFVDLGDLEAVKNELSKGDVCAVIIEFVQGVGGLGEGTALFYETVAALCKEHEVLLIADEIQCGYGRTGDFFAFQKYNLQPDIISIAKGMGNGFPIGGILLHPTIEAQYGMLGTTFGGNHLACAAAIGVLDTIEKEGLLENTKEVSELLIPVLDEIPQVKKVKGRGLMLGVEFDFPIKEIRSQLLHDHHIFTGASSNPNLLRILPPLSITIEQIMTFPIALKKMLK